MHRLTAKPRLDHDLRDSAQLICCHQQIAADSCYALSTLGHYESATRESWRYRALHWECGLLGLRGQAWQSLYHFTAGGAVEDARLTTLPAYRFDRSRYPTFNSG